MDNFNRIFNILWSIFAFGGGIYLIIYREQFMKLSERVLRNRYKQTGFFLFKLQAENMNTAYIRTSMPIVGIFFLIAGIIVFLQNI